MFDYISNDNLGYLAAFLTSISFLFQVYQVYKTKKTNDLNLYLLLTLATGVLFWLVWGIRVDEKPAIYANSITLIFVGYILFMKIKLDIIPELQRKGEKYEC